MPEQSAEATSPASTGDAKVTGSGNLTQGQAAARLFATAAAQATAPAETVTAKPPTTATEETAPEKSEETIIAPVAEAPAASVESEVEAETETAPAAEDEAKTEDDSVHSQSTSELSPEQEAILHRRIAKEVKKTTAMREAMEAKVADLEAKLAAKAETPAAEATLPEPATQTPAPSIGSGAQPLASYNDLASLGTLQQQAKAAVRWAEETLDTPKAWKTRVDVDPDSGDEVSVRITANGDQTYTEAQVKSLMRTARITLEDQIPARAQFISARQRAQTTAHQEFPFLTDKNSPEYQQAKQMLKDPWVQMRHDAEWIVGMHIRGMKALEAEKAAKKSDDAKPKVKAPAAKPSSDQTVVSATSPTARAPAATVNKAALAAEQQKLRQKGGITTAEAIASLQNRERIRNSR